MDRGNSLRRFSLLALAGMLAVLSIAPQPVLAQRVRILGGLLGRTSSGDQPEGDVSENIFISPDRTTLQQLHRAEDLLRQERYADAARALGAVLDNPEDYFYAPDKKSGLSRSIKGEAQRLIGAMPDRGLAEYRLMFGARAKQLLVEAAADGDADGLAEVARRFYHTEAGYEATFLLGIDQLNRAQPLAAALTLDRLRQTARDTDRFEPTLSLALATAWLQAGMEDKAREALAKLQTLPRQPMRIGGRQELGFTAGKDPLKWFTTIVGAQQPAEPAEADRWLMFRGSPARNAAAEGGAPLLNLRWQIPIGIDSEPAVNDVLQQLRQLCVEQDVPTMPGLHPLAVNDRVLFRTAKTLLAVDFASGKRKWEVPIGNALHDSQEKTNLDLQLRQQPQWAWNLGQHMWGDATFGTLSSDGELVYSIEDLPSGMPNYSRRAVFNNGMVRQGQSTYDRLTAYSIRTGKMVWQAGGPADEYSTLPLAESFFLGPPLPLMGQVYALAELKGEGAISLLALDPRPQAKQRLLWSQSLATVEATLAEDPQRRTAGLSPSYADGVVVCPTAVGAVVAVDLSTRSLLWGYRYPRSNEVNQNLLMMQLANRYQSGQPVPLRWQDATATIVGGKVLVTPPDSDQVHCLDLRDGHRLWAVKRQDDLYLAGVYHGKVILVGRHNVRALNLDNGNAAWDGRNVALGEAAPSGRGFLSDNKYYVPLSTAEVAAVDVDAGKLASTAKSRKGQVPGNLICYKGWVISQSFDGVETFYQLESARREVAQRLAARPDDPTALSLKGEILLDQSKRDEAVDCFRRSYAADRDVRTRDLLRDALLDGLQHDFADYRGRFDEVAGLVDNETQRATLVRLMATGLQAAGQWQAAFEQYANLMHLDRDGRRLDVISSSYAVRRDRWVQSQLARLVADAKDPAVRRELDAVVQKQLDAALASDDIAPLREFLEYFGNQPAAGTARRELVKRLARAGRVIEAEMAIWNDQQSRDPAVAGPAVAFLAQLMRDLHRPGDAAVLYNRLQREFAAVPCLDGKTGQQLCDALPGDDPVRRARDEKIEWPVGLVEASRPHKMSGSRQPTYGRFPVQYDGSGQPFFRDIGVQYDQNQRAILARDGLGGDLWKVNLAEGQNQNIFFQRAMTDGAVHGHLLLLSLGSKLVAVDGVGNAGKGAKLLWDRDLTSTGADLALSRQLPVAMWGMVPWAFQQFNYNRMSNRMSGIGPVTNRIVCYQRFRTLVALDPASGETLWTHTGLPLNCELFGDDEYVFALPYDKEEAGVYRALDGASLGTRKIPRAGPAPDEAFHDFRGALKYVPFNVSCLANFGRQSLLWRRVGGQRVLELFDPWEQKQLWEPKKFDGSAKVDTLDNEVIGICEPNGHFVLLGLPDGRTIVDTQLKVEGNFSLPQQIMLLRGDDGYLVITSHQPQGQRGRPRNIQPLPGMMMQPILAGWVFAFDKAGKPAWPHPVQIDYRHLAPQQPSQVPVLVFASQEYKQITNNSARNYILIKCIDKRTGRVVYDSDSTPQAASTLEGSTGTFEIVGDAKAKTVDLRLQQYTITLHFTDKPMPPEEQKPAAAEKKTDQKPVNPAKAVLRALGRGVSGVPLPDLDDLDPFQ